MASQVVVLPDQLQDCETVVKELERTYGLTTQLQQEVATILNHSVHFEVEAIFQELQRALKSSLNFLCNAQVVKNHGIQGSSSAKRKRLHDDGPVRVVNSRTVGKEVIRSDNPFDDGYLWRKYGRKNILNETFPRDYYRCIYSKDHTCKAKKYVQKYCNGDPPQYKVIYTHSHTCNCNTSHKIMLPSPDSDSAAQPFISNVSSSQHGSRARDEEEQAALLSCLKDVVGGGGGTSRQMDSTSAAQSCDDVVSVSHNSQPMEPISLVNLASTCQPWDMDDILMMDLFCQQSSQINYF